MTKEQRKERMEIAREVMVAFILSGQSASLKVLTAEGTLELPAREGLPKLSVQYADNLIAAVDGPENNLHWPNNPRQRRGLD